MCKILYLLLVHQVCLKEAKNLLLLLLLLQVFDATNTTSERRDVILGFAKENGYKVPPSFFPVLTSA